MATVVLNVELTRLPTSVANLEAYTEALALYCYRGQPIAQARHAIVNGRLTDRQLLEPVLTGRTSLWQHWLLSSLGLEAPTGGQSRPSMTVAVCTRDRPADLQRCLSSLASLPDDGQEVLVIDNHPATDTTERLLAEFPTFRYIREDRAGLNNARNRALREARHEVVAFTDDDTVVTEGWLRALQRNFDDATVMGVTGLTMPLELETEAQEWFERYSPFGRGFERRVYRRGEISPRQLLWASTFGVGTNMAFRRSLFAIIGGFDVALDVGTASGGGGDIELFHRCVAQGFTLVYEPMALVWHQHRRDYGALRRLMFDNGRGFGAYLLTCWRNRSVSRLTLLRFALLDWLTGRLLRRLLRPGPLPRQLIMLDLLGALLSPLAWRAARQSANCLEHQGQPVAAVQP